MLVRKRVSVMIQVKVLCA